MLDLRTRGFNRLYQNGQIFEFSTPESLLDMDFSMPVFVLVDRLVVSADRPSRIVDAIETAYRESGEVIFETAPVKNDSVQQLRFSQRFECKGINRYEEPEPRLFSFNNPYGACPRCQGFGNTIDFDLDLVIPDKSKTLNEGAIEPWTKPKYRPLFTEVKRFAKQTEFRSTFPGPTDAEHQKLIVEWRGQVFRSPRILRASGAQEVQIARERVSEPVSRIFGLLGPAEERVCGRRRSRSRLTAGTSAEVCSMTVEQAADFLPRSKLTRRKLTLPTKC